MKRASIAVFGVALAVRLLVIAVLPGWQLEPSDLVGDPSEYHAIAANVAAGRGYTQAWPGAGPHHGELRPTALRAPLGPIPLALLYRVTGPRPAAGRMLLAVLDALTCALLVPLGSRLAGVRVGAIAGAAAAVYPQMWIYVTTLFGEPAFRLAIVVCLLAAMRVHDRAGATRPALLLGLVIGIAALGRPNGFVVVPALAGWAAWRARRAGARRAAIAAAACALGALVVVAPWVVGISRAMGGFVPVTTQSGPVLAGSFAPRMLDRDAPEWGGWDVRLVVPALLAAPDEITLDRGLQRAGRSWIAEHPRDALTLVWLHVLRYLDLYWRMPDRLITLTPSQSTAVNEAAVVTWWGVAALAVAAVFRLRRTSAIGPWLPGLVVLASFGVTGLLAAAPRYRAPVEPIVLLLAASHLARRTKAPRVS